MNDYEFMLEVLKPFIREKGTEAMKSLKGEPRKRITFEQAVIDIQQIRKEKIAQQKSTNSFFSAQIPNPGHRESCPERSASDSGNSARACDPLAR